MSVSFFSAATWTPGARIHPLDHVNTVLELIRPVPIGVPVVILHRHPIPIRPVPPGVVREKSVDPQGGRRPQPVGPDGSVTYEYGNRCGRVGDIELNDIARGKPRGKDGRRNR